MEGRRPLTSSAALAAAVVVLGGVASGGCDRQADPYGSVIVELDTDLPVPRLASRARLDIHGEDGTWIESRDVPLRDASEFPASFTVFASDDSQPRSVLVRVRLGLASDVVDYGGERRLLRDGVDVTPSREPDPAATVDRVARVTLRPGAQRRVLLLLEGACSGVPADLDALQTCGRGGVLEPVGEAEAELSPEQATLPRRTGTFGVRSATLPVLRAADGAIDQGEAPIPGAAFLLGSRDLANEAVWGTVATSSAPPRVVEVSPFVMDRTEVTVGRYRRALARGFTASTPVDPVLNPEPIPTASEGHFGDRFCTFRGPADASRDAMPLTCTSYRLARAFCMFEGGDLPTEAEWELAATASSRPAKTTFPWGDHTPTCEGAVFSRMDLSSTEHAQCSSGGRAPIGPAPAGTGSEDVTPDGIRGLGGNVAEWTRDAYGAYDGACWKSSPRLDPSCESDTPGALRTVRGGSFAQAGQGVVATIRRPVDPVMPYPGFGFRCVRHGPAR